MSIYDTRDHGICRHFQQAICFTYIDGSGILSRGGRGTPAVHHVFGLHGERLYSSLMGIFYLLPFCLFSCFHISRRSVCSPQQNTQQRTTKLSIVDSVLGR